MKSKIKRIVFPILIVLLLSVLTFAIINLSVRNSVSAATGEGLGTVIDRLKWDPVSTGQADAIVVGEDPTNANNYNIDSVGFDAINGQAEDINQLYADRDEDGRNDSTGSRIGAVTIAQNLMQGSPKYGEWYDIYCAQPGKKLRHYDYRDVTFSHVNELIQAATVHLSTNGWNHSYATGELKELADDERITALYAVPQGSFNLPPAAAYIVSADYANEKDQGRTNNFTLDKQRGLWNLRQSTVTIADQGITVRADQLMIWDGTQWVQQYSDDGSDNGYNTYLIKLDAESSKDGNSTFDQEAVDYATYDYQVRYKGLGETNNTNANNIVIEESNDRLTIGEFTVSYKNGSYSRYTDGTYTGYTFSGISAINVIYSDKNGNELGRETANQLILYDQVNHTWNTGIINADYFNGANSIGYVDRTEQRYPASGQPFKIVIDDPNVTNKFSSRVATIDVEVEFQYMLATGYFQYINVDRYKVQETEHENTSSHYYTQGHPNCDIHGANEICQPAYLQRLTSDDIWAGEAGAGDQDQQKEMITDGVRTIYKKTLRVGNDLEISSEINIGGNVWEDGVNGKESKADGLNNSDNSSSVDRALKNIKVTLYTSDGQIAKLESDPNEAGISEAELLHRINPTYTDSNGNYLFRGVDPDQKYYVVFEYNGLRYLPTEYLKNGSTTYNTVQAMVNAGQYNTDAWRKTSKGTEAPADSNKITGVEISRNAFDNRFAEIRSYPQNYRSSNSLGVGTWNATYSQLDLMGYTLGTNGTYSKTGTQLIDGYLYDSRGLETKTYSEGAISAKVREFIRNNKRFPSDSEMKTIYTQIANGNTETLKMLQFIEDSYIQAYSGSAKTYAKETYLVDDNHSITINEEEGEYYVNLGLWRRQEFDAALMKDVYKATVKINGKTAVYTYDERRASGGTNSANGQDNNTYWDINVRMSDYTAYYGKSYNRQLYGSDYTFGTTSDTANHPGEPLEVYVTYKITIRNQSQSVMGQIKEVVDYYDTDYTYRSDLSWVTYDNNTVTDAQYYNAMDEENISRIASAKNVNSSNSSRYGSATQSNINGYNTIYIKGLENKKLATGESAYIYLTFQVNKDSNGRVIVDVQNAGKNNIAEINGYATFYRNGTTLPNGVTKSSNNSAGLLDRDSNPGNLVASDLTGSNYERNFEDDTDRAPTLRLFVDDEAVREANGVVWEDERTTSSSGAMIGDGIRGNGETKVSGVTVQLIEKCVDGSERIWSTTSTNRAGEYSFSNYIPGDYIIRFQYGNTEATVVPTNEQPVSYNGQDFKSTTYHYEVISPGYNVNDDNESGTYTYDISRADNAGVNYSDAKDIWSRRQAVNNYSSNNVTNEIAEVLASPYTGNSSLYQKLIENTSMVAETGVINAEIEYNQSGVNSEYNSTYVFNNVDFGLEERPKAQLELDKSVANVNVILANGTTLFDVNSAANNALWQDHQEYSIDEEKDENGIYSASREDIQNIVRRTDKGLIQLTMDQELMHGATIRVTYNVKVTNVGEIDYASQNFYYIGTPTNGESAVTTTAEQVVDYVANNLQFDSNNTTNTENGWTVITADTLINEGLVDSSLAATDNNKLAQFNTIIQTETLAEDLVPGQEASSTLVLSQLITAQNSDDDLTYENIVEIVKTSNTVGRRMEYSIVGNQDPTEDPEEVDSSAAERIIILPPFGIGDVVVYGMIALVIGAVLVVGIVLIRRKVLKGKNS